MGRQITESQALWAIIAVLIVVDALWAWSIGMGAAINPVAALTSTGVRFLAEQYCG